MPDWNGKFVLRRVKEDDPQFHRIYKFGDDAADITDADNYFSTAPVRIKKSEYDAHKVTEAWLVTLAGQQTSVEMAVYQLERI
ncbi:MAG: hypothetical protein ABW202_23325 [Duganella sp.]